MNAHDVLHLQIGNGEAVVVEQTQADVQILQAHHHLHLIGLFYSYKALELLLNLIAYERAIIILVHVLKLRKVARLNLNLGDLGPLRRIHVYELADPGRTLLSK